MGKFNRNIIIKERKRWLFLGLPLSFKVYTLTDKQLFYKFGFLNVTEEEIQLYRIVDVTKKRSFWQSLVGIGTLVIYSKDRTNSELVIKNIAHYDDFYHYLTEAVEKERIRYRVRPGEIIDSGPMGMDTDGDGYPDM